jgi:lipoprotein-releasing system ATP-binding protein
MSTILEARDVSKIYQMGSTQVAALDHVSLGIEAGEFVAIQGTSGSGKSTLLNMLGGLDRPTSGEVLFDKESLAPFNKKQIARYRRHSVGMIFQNFNLISTMTAAENVSLALAFGGLRGREREERARGLLERVGLADRLKHRPSELSGGEQQRVAIARAVANAPRVLLADEPTGNLDPQTAGHVFTTLVAIVRASGLAALIATHNMDLAARMDRRVTIRDGLVVEVP